MTAEGTLDNCVINSPTDQPDIDINNGTITWFVKQITESDLSVRTTNQFFLGKTTHGPWDGKQSVMVDGWPTNESDCYLFDDFEDGNLTNRQSAKIFTYRSLDHGTLIGYARSDWLADDNTTMSGGELNVDSYAFATSELRHGE